MGTSVFVPELARLRGSSGWRFQPFRFFYSMGGAGGSIEANFAALRREAAAVALGGVHRGAKAGGYPIGHARPLNLLRTRGIRSDCSR